MVSWIILVDVFLGRLARSNLATTNKVDVCWLWLAKKFAPSIFRPTTALEAIKLSLVYLQNEK